MLTWCLAHPFLTSTLLVVLYYVIRSVITAVRYPNRPPTAKGSLPLVGAAVEFGTQPDVFLAKSRAKYGNVFVVDLLVQKMTFILGKEAHAFIFSAKENVLSFEEAVDEFVRHAIGDENGLYDNKEWNAKSSPTIVKGFLNPRRLQAYTEIVVDESHRTVSRWVAETKRQGQLDLFREVSRAVMAINIRCFVGEVSPAVRDELCEKYYELENTAFQPIVVMMPKIPTPMQKRAMGAKNRIFELLMEETVKRMAAMPEKPVAEDDAAAADDDALDYLSLLVKLHGRTFAPKVFAKHILSLMFAGHTNTAATFGWTVAHLAKQRELQEQLTKELDTLYTSKAQDVGALRRAAVDGVVPAGGAKAYCIKNEDLNQLTYLDACMKETVRHYSLLMVFRKAVVDVEFGGKTIPKGSIVCASPMHSHHDPEVFPDPTSYNPARFLDQELTQRVIKDMTFVQFGFGKHRCLGNMFANLVLKTGWALLFESCEFSLVGDMSGPDWSHAVGTPFSVKPTYVRCVPRQ